MTGLEASRGPLRVGVFGTGALGRHHVRILAGLASADLTGVDLIGVHDLDRERAQAVAAEFGTRAFENRDELAGEIQAAVVATPTSTHCEIGCELLERGVHALVEKPIARDLEEADRMLAAAGDRVLAVGHVEFYNPAVQALLGMGLPPGFAEVHRLGSFSPRSLDIDVVLDLMIHDLQILHSLDRSRLEKVSAVGVNVLTDRFDIANVRLEFASGFVANVTASRVSDQKVRKLRLIVPGAYLSLDYQAQEIKGYRLRQDAEVRDLEKVDLAIQRDEPLRCELAAFLAACSGEDVFFVDGAQGRQALSTALTVGEKIAQHGFRALA